MRRIFVEYREISPTILAEHEALHQAAINRESERAEKLLSEHILFAARLTESDARKKGLKGAEEVASAAELGTAEPA